MAIMLDDTPPGIVGYFVWERTTTKPRAAKFHADRDGMNKWSDDHWKQVTVAKWPLLARAWALDLDTLAEIYPCPVEPPAPEPGADKVSTYLTLTRLVIEDDKSKPLNGYTLYFFECLPSFNIGDVNLSTNWKRGARVKASFEIVSDEPTASVGTNKPKPDAEVSGEQLGKIAGAQEHSEVLRTIGVPTEGDGQEHGVIMDAILGRG